MRRKAVPLLALVSLLRPQGVRKKGAVTSMKALFVPVVAMVVVLIGPSASAATVVRDAPARGFISISRGDAECLGERITFGGSIRLVSRATESASGKFSTTLVIVLRNVVGTGVRTGQTYHIVGTLKDSFNHRGELLVWTFNVVGGRNRILGHLLLNRRGEVLADRYVCR